MFSLGGLLLRWRLKWIFACGLSFGVLRFALSAMNGKLWVLAGVLLHGCSFTLVLITAQIYLEQRVDAAWRARAQALLTLMTSGVGNLLGYLGTGWWFSACTGLAWHAMVALLGRAGRGGRRGDGLLPDRLPRHRLWLPAREAKERSGPCSLTASGPAKKSRPGQTCRAEIAIYPAASFLQSSRHASPCFCWREPRSRRKRIALRVRVSEATERRPFGASVAALAPLALGLAALAQPLDLQLRSLKETKPGSDQWQVLEVRTNWAPEATAAVICDMWDQHWCKGATARVAEMAPRMNQFVSALRARGVLIIHCPSETMKFYEGTPGRKLAQSAPPASPQAPLKGWGGLDPKREPPLPIDDSDGGCDDDPPCAHGRALAAANRHHRDQGRRRHHRQHRGLQSHAPAGHHQRPHHGRAPEHVRAGPAVLHPANGSPGPERGPGAGPDRQHVQLAAQAVGGPFHRQRPGHLAHREILVPDDHERPGPGRAAVPLRRRHPPGAGVPQLREAAQERRAIGGRSSPTWKRRRTRIITRPPRRRGKRSGTSSSACAFTGASMRCWAWTRRGRS